MNANEHQTPLPLRSHTILGVCEAIGEDFGFNPNWLRVPFAATVLLNPMWSVVGYLALGLVVLASRLLFPRSKGQSAKAEPSQQQAQPAPAFNEVRELAEAA